MSNKETDNLLIELRNKMAKLKNHFDYSINPLIKYVEFLLLRFILVKILLNKNNF